MFFCRASENFKIGRVLHVAVAAMNRFVACGIYPFQARRYFRYIVVFVGSALLILRSILVNKTELIVRERRCGICCKALSNSSRNPYRHDYGIVCGELQGWTSRRMPGISTHPVGALGCEAVGMAQDEAAAGNVLEEPNSRHRLTWLK